MRNPIFQSASRLVFVVMALAVIALTFIGRIDAKDFIALASMAFAAHYARNPVADEVKKE